MGSEKMSYKRSWRVLEKVDGWLQAPGLKEENLMYLWKKEKQPSLQ
jgi:hypothetical protein